MKTQLSDKIYLVALTFALFFTSACSHDHKVRIEPELYVRSSDRGQGTAVILQVVDRRPRRAIYEKDAGPRTAIIGSFNKVNIYPSSSISEPIRDQIRKGLSTLGFQPVGSDQKAQRRLKVHLLHLKMIYNFEDPQLKIPKKKVRLRTALGVIAEKPGKKYKKLYQTYQDKSQNLLTGEFKNEQFINDGLSLTLQEMFQDPALLLFLSPEE